MDKGRKKYVLVSGYAKAAGYSMQNLAEEIGVSRRTLSNKINGVTDFTLSEAMQLKKILGKSLEEIFLQNEVA